MGYVKTLYIDGLKRFEHFKIEFGLSTLFQTNFFRLFFRYCTGV